MNLAREQFILRNAVGTSRCDVPARVQKRAERINRYGHLCTFVPSPDASLGDGDGAARQSLPAFTLIELLIAVMISATVLIVVNTLFFGALRLRDRVTDAAEQSLPVDNAISIMKHDLAGIVPVGTLAGPMGTDATGIGTTASPALEIFTADGTINADKPWGDIQKIDYSLQSPGTRSSSTGRNLVRGVTRNLLAITQLAPDQQPILTDVQNLTFSYYDGTNWNDTWSTSLSNIPIAIKVSIDFATSRSDTQLKPSVQFLVPIVTWDSTNSITNQLSN